MHVEMEKCNISRENTEGTSSDLGRVNLRRCGQGSSGSLCVPPLRFCVTNLLIPQRTEKFCLSKLVFPNLGYAYPQGYEPGQLGVREKN